MKMKNRKLVQDAIDINHLRDTSIAEVDANFIVAVWKYNEGEVTHVGLGHTSPITRLRISPDQKRVITVSEDGAIYTWQMPPMIEAN